jgi:polygalacturonase
MKSISTLIISASLCLFSVAASAQTRDYNIKRFGAKADDKTINTKAIQQAIDQCSANSGRVIIPAGVFLSGSLQLKDNVNIYLEDGAILKGSADMKDYAAIDKNAKSPHHAFLSAENASHITISGKGTVNGNGLSQTFQFGDDSGPLGSNGRPMLIHMSGCKDITVEDLHLENSAYWMQKYIGCENVHLNKLTIYNHANYNNDGFDIDSKNVLIENCTVDSDDDGLCLKSEDASRPCENVTIRNCTVASNCNGIKFGTASHGGFRNINISNITVKKASEDRIRHWQKGLKFIDQPITVLSGIAVENVDGGLTDNVNINNIWMTDVQTPIFIKLGNRNAAKKPGADPGHLRNVTISNVTAESHSKMTSSITGFPGHDVENVVLSNIHILAMGAGTAQDVRINPTENAMGYPENRMFGQVLPAGGLFVRHVNGLSLLNCTWQARQPDERPVVLLSDVKNVHHELLRAEGFSDNQQIVQGK